LARNENCALRCLYHGWLIDATGRILEMPAEPSEAGFANRVRAVAYPAHEAAGVVWTYMGPAGKEPPKMDFGWTALPASHVHVMKAREECNWAQCLEGVLDSAHSNYLHSNLLEPSADIAASIYAGAHTIKRPSNDGAPRIEAESTGYGFRYAAIRKPIVEPESDVYVRVTLFIAPMYAMFPAPQGWGAMQAFVPVDDTHTMFHYFQWRYDEPIDDAERLRNTTRAGLTVGVDLDSEYIKNRTARNIWKQDREAMRGDSFSGITGVNNEDIAVQESMGPRYDRTREHLGASDVAVIRMRRLMLDSVRRFDQGEEPFGLAEPVRYDSLRAFEAVVPKDVPWQRAEQVAVR
jgi:phthalate 4,5-dioxygenase